MRATRAYIAGIGTSGVLLVFAALLLIVLGALLGFRGWPGGSTAQRVDTLVIEAPDRPLSIARVAADDRARSPRAADADGGTAGGGTAGPAGSVVRDGVLSTGSGRPLPGSTGGTGEDRVAGGGDGSRPIGPTQGGPAPPVSAPPAPPPGPAPPRPPPTNRPGGVSPITDELGGTTGDLVGDLGLLVKPLSPPLGELVQDGGGELGGGLVDLGHLIDGTLPLGG